MEGIKSHKKRKRPFNWDDIYQSSSEDERQIIKKRLLEANFNVNATFQSSSEEEEELNRGSEDPGCSLCGHLKYGGCDVKDVVENSQHTYADVLQRLLGRSESESKSSDQKTTFEEGKLCTICKVRLQNLYRLQKELREEKSGIINVFKESENVRRGRNIEKNVEQILTEMRKARKLRDKSKVKKKKLFKNKSDSLLDYNIPEESRDQTSKKTPEQNKSNVKRFEIHSIKKRKGERFLIKWEGYSDEENTWEHRSDIPQYVLKYYEDDQERFGLPAPKIPNKFRVEEPENSSDEETKKEKKRENFDINSIIDGLYKDDSSTNPNLKITLKKSTSSNFYIEPDDPPSSHRVPTKAALKQSDESKSGVGSRAREMSNILQEEEEIDNFNISFESKAAAATDQSHDTSGPNETDEDIIVDDSPPPPVGKTKVLGKIFVSTPDRRRSEDVQSEEMIKAVLREEDIYNIEALVDKKGSKYLVKWENFPHEQNTWEPRSAIPPFIIKYYEQNLSRLGRPVPAPPSPESEYVPAVDSIAEDSDGLYEQDDDWKPSDKKKRRKSGAISKKSKSSLESLSHANTQENTNKLSKKLSR